MRGSKRNPILHPAFCNSIIASNRLETDGVLCSSTFAISFGVKLKATIQLLIADLCSKDFICVLFVLNSIRAF